MSTIQRTARGPLPRARGSHWGGSFTGRRGGSLVGRAARAVAGLLILWQKRLRDRECLRLMTDSQLADIGIRRDDALLEAEKPFWRG